MSGIIKSLQNHPQGRLIVALMAVAILVVGDQAFAGGGSDAPSKGMNWWKMAMTLFGGLAIFLYGMELMSEALRRVAGDRMKDILAKMTTNPVIGVFTGALTTAVVQSSSVTTVVVVGFVTAGLMNLNQALGVIFGANIGTTITAQIVAFKVTKYALLMLGSGWLISLLAKEDRLKQWGIILMGLGMVFFGMHVMSDAMKPLRSFGPFLDLMKSMENPLFGILLAAGFTGLIQSSSATTSIVIVMASQGLVTLPAGIALAFGANIGTCVTAMLACIGKPREAVRAAVAHMGFNVIGVIIWFPFISMLADAVVALSPVAAAGLSEMDRISAEVPRQIANAHTVFNITNTIIFLPFTSLFGKLITRLVKDAPVTAGDEAKAAYRPKYLDEGMLSTPALALSMARREAGRMGEVVEEMLKGIPSGVFKGNVDHMAKIRDMDNRADILYGEIAKYLARIGQGSISAESSDEAMTAMTTVTELENIGDIVETNMYHLATVCSASHLQLDEESLKVLTGYHEMVVKAFHGAMAAYEHDRPDAAKMVLNMESDIVDSMEQFATERRAAMIKAGADANAYAIFTLESDTLENFKRIYYHTKRIARLVMHQEGASALVAV